VVCGDILTVPDPPRSATANRIHLNADGDIEGRALQK
jgi:formyltetrahydrofolate synthetase